MKKSLCLVVLFSLGCSYLTLSGQYETASRPDSLLDARVQAGSVKDATLPQALLTVQSLVEGQVVLFGVELNSDPKKRHFRFTTSWPESSLREVLDHFMVLSAGYSYSLVLPNVVHIYPARALSDPNDLLNVRVRRFKIDDGDYRNTITAIHIFAPELHREILIREGRDLSRGYGYIGPGLRSANIPTLSIEMTNTTIREILNQILQESASVQPRWGIPVGWVYEFQTDNSLPGGGKPTWRVLE